MKWSLLVLAAALALNANAADVDLSQARRALKENQPAKAAEVIRELQSRQPADPWLAYNQGVAAYAAKDYEQADKIWQELATRNLPPKLRDQVWAQIGNVSFRRGEPLENANPQATLPLYEQSREAYRIFLVENRKDKTVNHNLKVVELKLAKLHTRLAQNLLNDAATKRELEPQIQLMQAALDHQRTAQYLDKENQQYAQDTQKTEQALAQKFNQKAAKEEKKADSALAKENPSSWERRRAEEELRKALSDFQEAKALDPVNQEAQQGEQRVQDKLAQLLAKEGQELQREGERTASYNPDQAIDKYEQALEKYEQALELDKEQPIAQKGEPEVKQALEQLHMKRGDQQAQEGEQQRERNLAQAAQQMMEALNHYQEALELNPENREAPPKIAALQEKLPPMLNELGQREQQQAAKQESQSLERAIGHLEKAANSYQRSQEVKPQDNEQAREGEQQAMQDLARLRQQLAAKNAQKPPQQQAKNQQKPENPESFFSLLSEVKDEEKQREYEQSRRAPTQEYTPDQNRIFKNW